MGGNKIFLLPAEAESLGKIIDSVPTNWSWIDGVIRCPGDPAFRGKVAFGTGYAISRFNCSQPAIVGGTVPGSRERQRPDLLAIMVENKLPGFVTFDMAGFGREKELLSARRIAASFIGRGYTGWVKFVKSANVSERFHHSASCEFRVNSSTEERSEVVISWEEKYGGNPKDIADVLAMCYSAALVPVWPQNQNYT